jgi:hypothetical protein
MISRLRSVLSALLAGIALAVLPGILNGQPRPESYWKVDDVRPGMKGQGKTVFKGTKVDSFDVEILGILRNTKPGRDLVMARLSGANLEKTGVIAGMSGSPVFIEGKLLGAVAYAWPFGKEPIAGITPFVQMHQFAEAYEKRDLAEKDHPKPIGLHRPLRLDGREFDSVRVSHGFAGPQPRPEDGLWLAPLKAPLAVSGMTERSLEALKDVMAPYGLIPVQGGAVGAEVPRADREVALEPGGVLSVAMVTGDFDMSGLGTVTHIEGKRVYGWGHPMMGLGACDFPLMTGYVHTIMPLQTVSFKVGSPLRPVGVINADVSTCIAGWLDKKADMLPVAIHIKREGVSKPRTFNIEVMRFKDMVGGILQSALVNCIDMEGEWPDDITASLRLKIEIEGRPPLILDDVFSGNLFAGPRGAATLFQQVNLLMNQINFNPIGVMRVKRIECAAEIQHGRKTAEIEAVELETDAYMPGETVEAVVTLRAYKGERHRVPMKLTLPADLADGSYTVNFSDDLAQARQELRDNPHLLQPRTLDDVYQALGLITRAKRSNLVMRLPTQEVGLSLEGKTLPHLPGSMVQILSSTKRTGVQHISGSVVARQATPFVITGRGYSIRFTVRKNKLTGGL